jgi:hypothetical protein
MKNWKALIFLLSLISQFTCPANHSPINITQDIKGDVEILDLDLKKNHLIRFIVYVKSGNCELILNELSPSNTYKDCK